MNTIDMRPKAEVETEEVKQAAILEMEKEMQEGEEKPDDASVVKDDQPKKEDEEEIIGTPLIEIEQTVEEETKELQEDQSEVRVNALKAEEEKLRKQISNLRTERRKERQEKAEEPLVVDKPDLSDVSEADLQLVEKILRAKGYVRKDELSAMSHKDKIENHKDAWLKEHPEYLPENDPEDKNWDLLNSTVSSYFKAPSNPEDIKMILDLAHSKIKPSVQNLPIKTKAASDAATEKLQVTGKGTVSSSARTSPVVKKSNVKVDRTFFHGFSDEELTEMGI